MMALTVFERLQMMRKGLPWFFGKQRHTVPDAPVNIWIGLKKTSIQVNIQ